MASSAMANRKNIAIFLLICIGIVGTQYMFKNKYFDDLHNYMTRLSSASMPSCDLPGNLITDVGKIRTPNLPNVKSIFPNIRPDRCIDSASWNRIEPLSQLEWESYNQCIVINAEPKNVSAISMSRLDYTVIYSFFTFLRKKSDVAIVELGGYTGQLLKKLIPTTGAKYYVVIEPVPSFYRKLSKNISMLRLKSSVTTYNFGLGKRYEELIVGVRGDATAVSKDASVSKKETIQIVSIVDFFIQLGLGCRSVELLTINCEGCEFDILETLIATSLIENFEYIQFQPHHAVPNLGNYPCRYCRLRQLLARTHVLAYDYPQVWEAWKSKNLQRYI